MTTKPMFTPSKADPDAYDITAPGCIILIAGYAYEPDSPNPALVGALRRILSAAAAGGFAHGDLLETMMARGEVSARVKEMACAAVGAAGNGAMLEIVAHMQGQCRD